MIRERRKRNQSGRCAPIPVVQLYLKTGQGRWWGQGGKTQQYLITSSLMFHVDDGHVDDDHVDVDFIKLDFIVFGEFTSCVR